MIYLDTSVALAQILAEDLAPPESLWKEELLSSRLLEYELWNRLHARGLGSSHGEAARAVLAEIAFLELSPHTLGRALEPFPAPVRTLDALHLASAQYLRQQGQKVLIAAYDERLLACARKMGIEIYQLS